MRLQAIVLGAFLLTGLSCVASPLSAAEPDTDEEAIRRVIAAGLAAANDHDASAMAKIFHKDATYTTPIGVVLRGPEAIKRQYALLYQVYDPKRGFPSFKETVVTQDRETIRFLRPDVAVADITYRLSDSVGPDGKPRGPTKGLVTYVLTREQGVWAVADKHNIELPEIRGRDAR
jgi:uncharacterized protein (TIGR02246 family)